MEVWYADLPMKMGSSVQGGIRPVVIISNDVCNEVSSVITVAPLTSRMKKLNLPTHCYFEEVRGLPAPSMVSLEQIKTIDKCRIEKYLGKMTREQMIRVEDAIRESLGMEIPECVEAP